MHPKHLLFLFSALLFCTALHATGIRGTLKDGQGKGLAFASIYAQENGAGAISNEEGYYELRLEPGEYTLVYQFLGYTTVTKTVTVGTSWKELDITLYSLAIELEEVTVYSGDEDPAYTVMRKAIAKADYHRNQLDYYQAQVYIKGAGRLLKAPFFLRRELAKEGVDSTVAFASESVSMVTYERPNTFKEKVISVYTTGDDRSTSPNGYINGSFYNADIAGAVSPLSPRAFGYYRFKLEGYFQERGYLINKIKITPRSRGDNVFEGYIYIIEDLWSIHSLELNTYKLGIKFDIKQIYAPVKEDVWLPVSAQFDISGKILGFAFEYDYLATLSKYDIRLNPELPADFEVVDEKIEKELAKELEAARKDDSKEGGITEKMLSGEELTRKELRKVMKAYEKEEREEQEEPEVVSNYEFKIDSNAYKQDSSFWAEVRPLPLTEYELRGYERQDSIAQVEKERTENTADEEGGNRRNNGEFSLVDLLFGESYLIHKSEDKLNRQFLDYKSPLMDVQFNPVEGWNTTGGLAWQLRKPGLDVDFGMLGRYGFSWRRFNFKGYLEYEKQGLLNDWQLQAEGGRYISQYNSDNPIAEIFNTVYALFSEKNFLHIYEKEYGALQLSRKLEETARLQIGAEWANRRTLRNTTGFAIFPKDDRVYPQNVPANLEADYPFPEREKAFILKTGVEVKPWQKYSIRNGRRRAVEHSSPSFRLDYTKGIPEVAESISDFDLLELTYQHKIQIPARGALDLRVNAGTFLNDEYVGFADFKHFPGNEILFTTLDPVGSFRLLPYYDYSTRQEFVAGHVHYQFRKFLLTQIWEVQLMGLRENVFGNYLYTPESQHYFEVGYSLDNILRFFRVEFAASFVDGTFEKTGFRLGVASNLGGNFIDIE